MLIASYDPDWPRQYGAEAEVLEKALGRLIVGVEHVGSTAVRGLAAKPIIDIQISVASLDPLVSFARPLESVGYVHVPDPDPEFERVYPHFRKPAEGAASCHVHLCVAGSEMERRHLSFRDYLRDHKAFADQYALLKKRLAAEHGLETRESRERYTAAKGPFIESIIQRATAAGYPKS